MQNPVCNHGQIDHCEVWKQEYDLILGAIWADLNIGQSHSSLGHHWKSFFNYVSLKLYRIYSSLISMAELSVLCKEIGERVTSGWRRFGDYSHFLRDKKIPTCLKRKIMDTVILPAMTYGAETWTLTKHLGRKLAVAQRSMERSLLNITRRDKIRNEIIRSKTGVIDIIEKVKCMKGQWAGHVARMKNTRWAKITSEWTPRDGKRLRGRPKRRWRDDIEEAVGSQWMRTAQDRSAWRKLWRPSASSGMNG